MTADLNFIARWSDRCGCGHQTSDHDPMGCAVCVASDDEPCTVDVFTLRQMVLLHAREWGFISDECGWCDSEPNSECHYR